MLFSKKSELVKTFTRIVSVVLVNAFLTTSVLFAAPLDKVQAPAAPKEVVTNPENVVIPREFGLVKSKSASAADKLIIHIQDAHCNYEAQSNIAKILETLIKNDSLRLVSVEGADGVIDTSWFKAFPDDAVRKEVADYFMKKGEITGPEFLSITTDLPIKLFGAETRAYYIENLNAFTSSYPLKADTERYLNTIKAALNKLKGFIYNDDLRDMDSKSADYESKKIQFNDYVRFLQAEAEKAKLNIRAYDNFFKLVNVLIYEKKIDFSVTDKERTNLIDDLTKRLAKDAITQLVTQSISFKIGKISSVDYYNYLKALAAANNIDLAKSYPNLYNYIIYNSVYSKIENEKLFNDIKQIETDIKEKLFANDDQRQLEKLSRHADILLGLINIKLLNGDFDYYKANKDAFSTGIFTDFIQKKGAQFGLAIVIDPVSDAVAKSISKLEDFYAIAIKRDKALVDNTLAQMQKTGEKIAVLVTGGFHSEGITRLLEKEGVSFMVVCPSITKDVPTPYIQVLTNQRTSFEDVVMGAAEAPAKTMLAPALWSWATKLDKVDTVKIVSVYEATLENRVTGNDKEWLELYLDSWIGRVMDARGAGSRKIVNDKTALFNAFAWSLEKSLDDLLENGVTRQQVDAAKAGILGSSYFTAEFTAAFDRAMRARSQAAQVESEQAPKPDKADSPDAEGAYLFGTDDADYVTSDGSEDEAERNKVSGASLTNKVVNRSLGDKDTKFLPIFVNGRIPPSVQRDHPQYAAVMKALIQTIEALDQESIDDIIRSIKATGVDTTQLAKVFTKQVLLDALKPHKREEGKPFKAFKIKLVQPKDELPGLRVPGIAMLRVGSNYGHYSTPAKNNSLYIPWGMVDLLLSEGSGSAKNIIIADIMHELTECVITQKLFPEASISDRNVTNFVHNVAERLERIIAPSKNSTDRSALDEKLAEITEGYFRAYTLKRLDFVRAVFGLGYSEVQYVRAMWRQFIDRHIHNRGRESLKIIKDRASLGSNYDPQQHGNFLLASMMTPEERREILGTHSYEDLAGNRDNAEAAASAAVTLNPLDGGIGENVSRIKFLRELAKKGVVSGDVKMGAKGTDMGYTISYKGRETFVSVAETKLLQLYTKLAEYKVKSGGRGMFASVALEPLVNYQSRKSYEKLFEKVCLFDRDARGQKRTYRDLLRDAGVEIVEMLEQSDLPWVDKETGNVIMDKNSDGPKKWQPGGHGYWAFYVEHDAWQTRPKDETRPQIRVFYNGDNLNSGVDENIVGAMVRQNWAIVKLTTMAAPIDKKGGKDGVRIVKVGDEYIYVPDQMEEGDAKAAKQLKEFYSAGLEGGLKGAAAGQQPFNTNIFYINTTLLHNILADLEKVIGKEAIYEIISPILISKTKKIGAAEYAPIDGAFGTAIHHLNEYFMTTTDPAVRAILGKHKVDRMLHFVDVPRTQFFTPVKKSFDMWLQADSDFYAPLDQTSWVLRDNSELPPPEVEFTEKPLDDSDPNNYWIEYQNYREALGRASTRGLRSLKIAGRTLLKDAVLQGNVVIMNKKSLDEVKRVVEGTAVSIQAGKKVDLAKLLGAVVPVDLAALLSKDGKFKSLFKNGRLVLKNVSVTINEDMTVTVAPYKGDARGAIRMSGGALSADEHRGVAGNEEASVNAAIGALIRAGKAFRVLQEGKDKPGDVEIEYFKASPPIRDALRGLGVNLVVIKGLKDELRRLGIAADLVFHPGVNRSAVYLDLDDFNYLLNLPNGLTLIKEAVLHEKAHIDDPNMSEADVEKTARSINVRMALLKRDLEMLEKAATSRDKAGMAYVASGLLDLSRSMNTLYQVLVKGPDKALKSSIEGMMVRKSVLARDFAGAVMEAKDGELLKLIAKRADSEMAAYMEGRVASGAMKADKAAGMLKDARQYIGEWLDPKNKMPDYMVQGIYRGMLEGRSADLLYSFGAGWREFGTAGIRNPALQSSFAVIQRQELKEFAANKFAPVLPGPNLIVAATLLQQEASIVIIMKDLQERIKRNDPSLSKFDSRFLEDVKNNRVTIAYDSRINGEYFAKLLAAAFLEDGIKVDLFDNAAGVPHLAWAANREHSAFGFLISASHSEANYNGFKAFLGYQMSQVDDTSKNMIVSARKEVRYDMMHLDLAQEGKDLDAILKRSPGLRWIGEEPRSGKDYFDKEIVKFYKWYYSEVKKRSPLAMLPEAMRGQISDMKKMPSEELRVLYTAFFGVGAVPAADFPGFLKNEAGYNDVDTVKSQTDVMDGMFPGHTSPDPGIVQGWISNLLDYFKQYAGEDLSGIEKAIEALNSREVGVATDPDIDRAGMMIALPEGVRGNIKNPLIAAIEEYMISSGKVPEASRRAIIERLNKSLNDKFLMTANDAWTFMVYWKLKMMKETGQLEKDRVYIIEKSHVTTSALERVAEFYRKPENGGYKVYVVDTYVGFTELGKKGRDLFAIAKLAWDAYNTITEQAAGVTPRGNLPRIIEDLEKANAELKSSVPYQTAGLPIITESIFMLKQVTAGDWSTVEKLAENLNALSRMHILAGVEESNGYGELGRWNRDKGEVELNHISDKDGSLAAFEFLEIISYGKYLKAATAGKQESKTAYDMYKEMTRDIGMVCTVNSALYHPGLTGVIEKLNEIEGLEKVFAYELQKRLSRGEEVKLFNGRYTVKRVEVYRAEKYDNNFLGFAEEGIRLYVETGSGSEVVVTYRPSGTGDSNRDYNWLLGKKPEAQEDFEAYRKKIEDEMAVMVRDFYGVEGQETGYINLSPAQFYGLLIALKEGGLKVQFDVFGKALNQGSVTFTETETALYNAVTAYALAAKKDAKDKGAVTEKSRANRAAWEGYLASPEVADSTDKLDFNVNGKVVARIPRSAMIAWQAGLVDHLIGLIMKEGLGAQFSFPDEEITALVNKRLPARFKGFSIPMRTIEEDVTVAAEALGASQTPETLGRAFAASINKTKLLNDMAETVGIKADKALEILAAAGMITITDKGKREYDLNGGFYSSAKLNDLVQRLIQSSDNPPAVDLVALRLERIILDSASPEKLFGSLAGGKAAVDAVEALEMNGVFQKLTAKWRLEEAKKASAASKVKVALTPEAIVSPEAAAFYRKNGVDVGFSMPSAAMVSPEELEALKNYNAVVAKDMARGGYNYRGTGTKQTVMDFFADNFAPKWRIAIQKFVSARFNEKEPIRAIITNGIGANDQFMWSLVRMYNENRPAGAPVWYHVTTAREFAAIVKRDGLKGANTLFIDISRSGGTWEGIEVAMRSMALGFNKRIAVANGGALVKIANAVAKALGKEPLVIGMSPDIGGRNMHRKTSIYYTAQTVAGMFLPKMDSATFAAMNNIFDVANGFAAPEKSLPVSTGRFLYGSMQLMGVDHIALITNSEPLRLVGTEWEQYIMEGSNKEDIISLGIHDLTKEPEHVLANLASGPAGKHTIGMALLDKASVNYARELERVNRLKETMPLMVFTINSAGFNLKGGMDVVAQAAFDILWTDMVTVFTTLLRVDANSNPNVKVVREKTAERVGGANAAQEEYKKDLIGRGKEKLLVSRGSPRVKEDDGKSDIGTIAKQKGLTLQNAADEARRIAAELAGEGLLKGRDRLNLFVGREDLLGLATELRSKAYAGRLSNEFGWITQTGVFPLLSHKGLEAIIAYSEDPATPLLANKTVNIFLNARRLPAGNDIYDQPFDNAGIMTDKYGPINGASVHATNDAMTMPNIKRMAEVSPTLLIEFNDTDRDVEAAIAKFVEALFEELSRALESERKAAEAKARKKDPNGGEDAGIGGTGNRGGRPVVPPAPKQDEANAEGPSRRMAPREEEVYNKHVRADVGAFMSLLGSLRDAPSVTADKTLVLCLDDEVVQRTSAQFADKAINRYITPEHKVIVVRGSGRQLLDNLTGFLGSDEAQGMANITVVTSASMDTLGKIGEGDAGKLGKVLEVEPSKDAFISPLVLVDVMLRIGYGLPDHDMMLERLNNIFEKSAGGKFTAEDLKQIIDATTWIIRVKPIRRIDPAELVEAYKAAQMALQSL
jgi:phosphomannomutase